jgi:trypsin
MAPQHVSSSTGRAAALMVAVTSMLAAAGPASAIIAGRVAEPGAYPWTVAIMDASGSSSDAVSGQFCGGVLVAPDRVLTAAHCLLDVTNPRSLRVVVGRSQLSSRQGETIPVKAYAVNPRSAQQSLSGPPISFDVGVLLLARPASAPPLAVVTPAEEASLLVSKAPVRALGWGAIRQVGASEFLDPFEVAADTLREADLSVVSGPDCERVNGRRVFAQSMVCVTDPLLDRSPVCHGDSGSPLVVKAPDGTWRLAGVASFTVAPCAATGIPAVYASVGAMRRYLPPTRLALAPTPTARPTVTGDKYAGGRLVCNRGTWNGGKGVFLYRWFWAQKDDPRETVPRASLASRRDISTLGGWTRERIPNANGPTLRLTGNDAGLRVSCAVWGRNASGSGVAASSAVKIADE